MDDTGDSVQRRSSLGSSMAPEAVEALRNEVRQALRQKETQDILSAMAENNGWTTEHMVTSPHQIYYLEMFLLTIPRLPELHFFPNLTVLKLLHISLESMEDLRALVNLEELWLTDNNIAQIEGIENMSRLRRLYLQGNRITSMDGLPVLKHLRELWLCRNAISVIKRLENVRKLRSLWVAGNPISSLKDAFGSYLTHLHDINLSGCRIYSFHHITHLTVLPCLRNVWLSDPLFGENPVCRLNNYTTYTLHMLDSLDTLDYANITPEQRALADSIYSKKHIYYSMRIQTLNRNYWLLRARAEASARLKLRGAQEARHDLTEYLLMSRGVLAERQAYQGHCSSGCTPETIPTSELEETCRELERAIGTREVEAEGTLKRLAEATLAAAALKHQWQEQLCLELNTGGNVRLEEVGPRDSWYESACELAVSRFSAEMYQKQFGITGVEVGRVFRLVNRGLRLRFDDRVKELDIDLGDQASRKNLVCLFTAVPADREGQQTLLQHVLVHGAEGPSAACCDPALRAYVPPTSEGVPLTNSLYYADEDRLQACRRQGELSGVNENPNALLGQLVVWRVYLGKSVTALGGGAGPRGSEAGAKHAPGFMHSEKKVMRKDYSDDVFSAYRSPSQDAGVRVWYCFDRALILPEFVIDYTYTLSTPMTTAPALSLFHNLDELRQRVEAELPAVPKSDWHDLNAFCHPLIAFMKWCEAGAFDQFAQEETQRALMKGEALATLLPLAASAAEDSVVRGDTDSSGGGATKSAALTESLVAAYAESVGGPNSLTYCHLRSRRLTAVPTEFTSKLLTALTALDLSNNSIAEFSWAAVSVAAPSLQTLNLSGNCLRALELRDGTMQGLMSLDLTSNQLERVEEFEDAPHCFPTLRKLLVEGNPMMETKNAGLIILSFFLHAGELTQLDAVYTEALSKPSLPRALYERTLDFSAGMTLTAAQADRGDGGASTAVRYIVRAAYRGLPQLGTSFDLLSLNTATTPEQHFELPVRQLTTVEARRKTRVMQAALVELGEAGAPPLSAVCTFQYHCSLLRDVRWVSCLPNLQHLLLRGHNLTDITPVQVLNNLEVLDVQGNCLRSLPDLSGLKRLREVNASFNVLTSLATLGALPELRTLSVSGNALDALETPLLAQCERLEELYMADNALSSAKEFYGLKDLPQLITLDVCCNPLTMGGTPESLEEVRFYFVYHFKRLKVLDGVPISQAESQKARETFSGKMNGDLLSERARVPQRQWPTLKALDLSHCALREVSLLDAFTSLEVLKLNHNALVKIDGVRALSRLKALNLSHNHLGNTVVGVVGGALRTLSALESLSLESNRIQDLAHIALQLPQLKFLNLKGNELQHLDRGLENLPELREIVLDQNKLRNLGTNCFADCPLLASVSADENAIRSVEGVQRLEYLESLSLGANRLGDLSQLLHDLGNCSLVRATFVGNPAARKSNYRTTVIGSFPHMVSLDGRDIQRDERERAETTRHTEFVAPPNVFIDMNYLAVQQQQQQQQGMLGIGPGMSRGMVVGPPMLPSAHGRLQPMSGNGPTVVQGHGRRQQSNGIARPARAGR